MSTELTLPTALELLPEPTLPPVARPLATQSGHTYAALWPYVRRPETNQPVERQLVFIRDDGLLHLPAQSAPALPLRPPLPPSTLPARLPVPEDRLWSAAGVQSYLAGYRPDPVAVFHRLTRVLSHFVDFTGLLAERPFMAELFAAYLLTTWFSPAFPVLPLLWISGDRGAGKSRLLSLLTQLSYIGLVLPALPKLEPLCALAALGASLALDDAQNLSAQLSPTPSWPRSLANSVLVAGRQRGPLLPVTHIGRGRFAALRQLDVSGPRLFASARQPHPALAGYCLAVTLFRSPDAALSARDPLDPAEWRAADAALPQAPRALTDDLWALALSRLAELPPHLALAAARVPVLGAGLQPWHAILAVASWLSALGVPGLFDRLAALVQPALNNAGGPATTDSAALVLQAIYVFAIALLDEYVKRYRRAVAGQAGIGDISDMSDRSKFQKTSQSDVNVISDVSFAHRFADDLGDTSPGGIYKLPPGWALQARRQKPAPAPAAPATPAPADSATSPLPVDPPWPKTYTFTAGAILECMQGLAVQQDFDLPRGGLSAKQVGRQLRQLGLLYKRTNKRRSWSATPAQILHLSRVYNLPVPSALLPALQSVADSKPSSPQP